METILTIIVLFAIIFFGKFIYDTYLTSNTERDFDAFRKIDPIGAAKIERPKTQEQFNDLVKAVENNLPINSENLSILFTGLMKKYPLMKITTDSPAKLELKSVGSKPLLIMSIIQNPEGQLYFYVSYVYIDLKPVSSDKFLLGSRASIVSNPPNWDKIFSDSIGSIGQKNTQREFGNDLLINSENLSKLFPDLMLNLSRMKITTDSPTKLVLEGADDDGRLTMTIEQKYEDCQLYFHASFIDIDSKRVCGDKFLIGSRAYAESNPPNWDRLVFDAINALDMKNIRQELENTITDEQKELSLRFDGYYYWINNIDGGGTTLILRFYPDGKVIHVNLMGNPYKITSWFKRDNEKLQNGNYTLNNYVFDFNVSSPERGVSYFVGYIKDNRTFNLIVNGTHKAEFIFMQIDENKTYVMPKQDFYEDQDFYIED